jgi:hypothetical protein
MRVHTGLRSHSRSNQQHTERHYRVKCDACKKQTTAYHGVCDNCGEYPGIVSSYGACPHDPIHTWKERGECIRQSAKERKRVRHVFSSGEIPHLWFHKTQDSAKNSNGSFFFENDTIYSYGSHFPIARHVQSQSGKRSAVLFTTKTYSISTSSHCSAVRTAIPEGTQVFNVPHVFTEGRYISEEQGRYASNEHANNLKDYADRVSTALAKCVRARQSYSKQSEHRLAIELREEAREYAKFFRLPMPKIAPIPPLDSKQLAAIKKREALASAKKAEKTRLENIEQAKRDAELAEKWRRNEYSGYLRNSPVMLRLTPDKTEVETTLGVRVPVSGPLGAARLLRVLQALKTAGRTYQTNGYSERVGPFTVQSFGPPALHNAEFADVHDAPWQLIAGCHRIVWEEIERIAPEVLKAEREENTSV